MSGAGIACCRICYHSLTVAHSDYINGTLCEREEGCYHCWLYYSSYGYGHTVERIGVIASSWAYGEDRPGDWRVEEDEAKRLWASDTAMSLVRGMWAKWDEETPRRVLADYCEENAMPLSAAYLRTTTNMGEG